MALGPIEILVIEFPGNQFTGAIIPELERLIANDTISVIDGLLVRKDTNGDVTFVEFDELGVNDDAAKLAGVVDQLDALISDEDVDEWASRLEPGSSEAILVFEHTWAEPILGFESNGAIISWLPLFLFVVLFGLSMDYHVFILSRVRENVDAGMNNDDAVREGLVSTAGVVTSAALVMFAVFAIFGSLSSLDVKEAGVGLAAAVLIDATIVRAVLLPSSMKLLGDWNWYLPRALRRLLGSG